jgi:hypothetical protein
MILSNPYDDAVRARERAEQADPLVMYLVVRREQAGELEPLLKAVARGVIACDRRYRLAPAHRADFEAWHAASYRKVTLRAAEADWAKLLASGEDLIVMPEDAPLLAILPPRRRSAAGKFLAARQAYVIAADELARRPLEPEAEPQVILAVNPALTMSAGKLAAQIGHAALMAADVRADFGVAGVKPFDASIDAAGDPPSESTTGMTRAPWAKDAPAVTPVWAQALLAWELADRPLRIAFPEVAGWEQAQVEFDGVAVTDHGLTEIEAGSRTVIAFAPLAGLELVRIRALLGV